MRPGKFYGGTGGYPREHLTYKLTTLEILGIMGRLARSYQLQAEQTMKDTQAVEGAGDSLRNSYLVKALRAEAIGDLESYERLKKEIESKRESSKATAPIGTLWTVGNDTGRYQMSVKEIGSKTWGKVEEHQFSPGAHVFLAKTIQLGDETEETLAPIVAASGDFHCRLSDDSLVGLISIRVVPDANWQVEEGTGVPSLRVFASLPLDARV